jgi:hypothetical protein
MITTERHIQELRERGFLTRLYQISGGDASLRMNAGAVGAELGLPLEQTLAIVGALHQRGDLHRCGKLSPPDGPEVHLTPQGAMRARPAA